MCWDHCEAIRSYWHDFGASCYPMTLWFLYWPIHFTAKRHTSQKHTFQSDKDDLGTLCSLLFFLWNTATTSLPPYILLHHNAPRHTSKTSSLLDSVYRSYHHVHPQTHLNMLRSHFTLLWSWFRSYLVSGHDKGWALQVQIGSKLSVIVLISWVSVISTSDIQSASCEWLFG
jgi:hypothetical protein